MDFVWRLLAGARDLGASILLGRDASSIETRGGRVTGVRCLAGREPRVIPADVVVLANGTGAQATAGTLGLDLGLRGEPAVLMRMDARPGLLRHVLRGSGLELRPGLPDGLVAAADAPFDGAAGLEALVVSTLEATAALFAPRPPPSFRCAASAARPMTGDGQPLCRFLQGVGGLYTLVAHPGVVLAPYLGRLAAEAVTGRLSPAS